MLMLAMNVREQGTDFTQRLNRDRTAIDKSAGGFLGVDQPSQRALAIFPRQLHLGKPVAR